MKKTLTILGLIVLVAGGLSAYILSRPSRQDSATPVAGFPEIPVYPDAVLINSVAQPATDGISYSSTWEVNSTVPEISDWYLKSLPESGWEIEVKPADPTTADIQNIISVKAENTLNLGIIRKGTDGPVEITAEFFPKPKDAEVETPIE